jgi:hypothetical protein
MEQWFLSLINDDDILQGHVPLYTNTCEASKTHRNILTITQTLLIAKQDVYFSSPTMNYIFPEAKSYYKKPTDASVSQTAMQYPSSDTQPPQSLRSQSLNKTSPEV